MSYIGQDISSEISVNKYEYTATAGQTTFACTYDRAVDVYVNGIKLDSSDFTATNGTAVVLSSGANAGDIVDINAYFDVTYANFYTQAEADARFMDIDAETLPDTTGNSGKFLQTDGASATWETPAASESSYDNSTSGLDATNVQAAIDEVASESVDASSLTTGALDAARLPTQLGISGSASAGSLNVDASGRVTMPYQPAFMAANSSGNITIPANGVFPFTNVQLNVGSHYNSSNGRFTAPVTGVYHFNLGLYYNNTSTDRFVIRRNGTYAYSFPYIAGGFTQGQISSGSQIIHMNAGDYAEIVCIYGTALVYGGHCGWEGYLVG